MEPPRRVEPFERDEASEGERRRRRCKRLASTPLLEVIAVRSRRAALGGIPLVVGNYLW